jgi:hypothetical protein
LEGQKIFVTNTKPINQKRNSIRLLRSDNYNEDEFLLGLLIAILENRKEINKDNIKKIDLKVYSDGNSKDTKFIDYMSKKLDINKEELLKALE